MRIIRNTTLIAVLAAAPAAAGGFIDYFSYPDSRFPGGVSDIVIGDFDGSGEPSMIAADAESGEVYLIRFDDANRQLVSEEGIPGINGPNSQLIAADFDGDGDDDLAYTGALTWHMNRVPEGGLLEAEHTGITSTSIPPYAVAACDLLGDGRTGVVYALVNGRLVWVARDPDAPGQNELVTVAQGVFGVDRVVATDLNRDGLTDVVIGRSTLSSLRVRLFAQTDQTDDLGHPVFVEHDVCELQGFGAMRDLAAGDLDGDGDEDLVFNIANDADALEGVHWIENWIPPGAPPEQPLVSFGVRHLDWSGFPVRELALVDVDQDTDLDIIGAAHATDEGDSASHMVQLCWNEGEHGDFDEDYLSISEYASKPIEHVSGLGAERVAFCDIGGDGAMDLVTASSREGIRYYRFLTPDALNTRTESTHATIAEAVDHAAEHDELLITPARFSQAPAIDTGGKPLTLRSRLGVDTDAPLDLHAESELRAYPGEDVSVTDTTIHPNARAQILGRRITLGADTSGSLEVSPDATLELIADEPVAIKAVTALREGSTVLATDGLRVENTAAINSGASLRTRGPLTITRATFVTGAEIRAGDWPAAPRPAAVESLLWLTDSELFAETLENRDLINTSGVSRVTAGVDNDATVRVVDGELTVVGEFNNRARLTMGGDGARGAGPALRFAGHFVCEKQAEVDVVGGDAMIRILGDFDNAIDGAHRFDGDRIAFHAVGNLPQSFEVAATDAGPSPSGFGADGDPLKALRIGPADGSGATLDLADNHDNDGAAGPPEALYVRTLTLRANARLNTNGINVYCQTFNDHGGDVDDPANVRVVGACPADLDGDGAVTSSDLATLISQWGPARDAADLDGDGAVSATDLAILISAWGPCTP